jgi:hypothetical protein
MFYGRMYCDRTLGDRVVDDCVFFKPRHLWAAHKNWAAAPSVHNMDALSAHWQGLYAV